MDSKQLDDMAFELARSIEQFQHGQEVSPGAPNNLKELIKKAIQYKLDGRHFKIEKLEVCTDLKGSGPYTFYHRPFEVAYKRGIIPLTILAPLRSVWLALRNFKDAITQRPSVSYRKGLTLIGYLVPRKTREQVYDAIVEELVEDFQLALRSFRTKPARAALWFIFTVRALVMLGQFCWSQVGDRTRRGIGWIIAALLGIETARRLRWVIQEIFRIG